ncbi:MAG: tRNA pseudouridine(13) synthase TruD [Planctomycetota bacterium]|nr:tRNA pseudouridine(13) synthase TruD [Planctomycetota bacterium]
MKVKQRPQDFRVEEKSSLSGGSEGEFALYRLEKSGLGTVEAIALVVRSWQLVRRDVAFSGLKDRYGVTGQIISIRRGPSRNLKGRGLKLNYLGRSPRPASRGSLLGNRFRIVLRDLSRGEADQVAQRARDAERDGYPDYYDDQRFGSLRGTRGRFVARALLDGNTEEALFLAIACPAREDRSRVKKRRRLLARHWGDWGGLADRLDSSVERRICARLQKGAAFQKAYRELDPALRSIHLAAYQAHLFNGALREAVAKGPSHRGADGPYIFHEGALPESLHVSIPLASSEAPPHPLLDEMLAREGVDRSDLARLPFRAGERRAVVVPEKLSVGEPEPDSENRGRFALELDFDLRPGSYATMLVKRCTWDF